MVFVLKEAPSSSRDEFSTISDFLPVFRTKVYTSCHSCGSIDKTITHGYGRQWVARQNFPRHSKTWIWLQRKSTLWSRKCKDKKPWLARPNNYDHNKSKKAYYLMSGIPSRQEALPLLPMGYAAWSRIVFAQSLYRLRHRWKLTSLLHRSLTHVADWLFVHKSSSETFQENIKQSRLVEIEISLNFKSPRLILLFIWI